MKQYTLPKNLVTVTGGIAHVGWGEVTIVDHDNAPEALSDGGWEYMPLWREVSSHAFETDDPRWEYLAEAMDARAHNVHTPGAIEEIYRLLETTDLEVPPFVNIHTTLNFFTRPDVFNLIKQIYNHE